MNQMETATSDEQIVERALSGDAEAFGELVRRWERRIFALSFGMLGREEDARDVTQETFIAAFRSLRDSRGCFTRTRCRVSRAQQRSSARRIGSAARTQTGRGDERI